MKQKIIAQGAEAKIFLNKNIITKDRIKKSYRIPEIDNKIIKARTKAETKLLTKASKIINTPKPFSPPDFNKIKMPFIHGKKLSQHLDKFPLTKQKQILKQIGKDIAKLHKEDIIHGDLTTSNMIYVKQKNSKTKTPNSKKSSHLTTSQRRNSPAISEPPIQSNSEAIFFIDFGLGFISRKYEDKAVDIHLLKQALEAKHFKHWEEIYKEFKKEYKKQNPDSKIIFERLESVEKRGRYRH